MSYYERLCRKGHSFWSDDDKCPFCDDIHAAWLRGWLEGVRAALKKLDRKEPKRRIIEMLSRGPKENP